jgi:uncharacterized damage-inducible protein DinB
MDQVTDAFWKRWEHVNEMTWKFAEAVPDSAWESWPHKGFAPFNKQLRHVICVRGVYNDGLVEGKVDFSRKHEYYAGGLDREELLAALHGKHHDLQEIIHELTGDPYASAIDFFGSRMTYADYFYGYVQHEALHHGQWSLYAAHGGYEVPEIWRVQWGLAAGAV